MAQILYFGKLKDVVGKSSEQLELPPAIDTTIALRGFLEQEYAVSPSIFDGSVRIAVNGEIVSEPFALKDTDEIAFLPPVGGG